MPSIVHNSHSTMIVGRSCLDFGDFIENEFIQEALHTEAMKQRQKDRAKCQNLSRQLFRESKFDRKSTVHFTNSSSFSRNDSFDSRQTNNFSDSSFDSFIIERLSSRSLPNRGSSTLSMEQSHSFGSISSEKIFSETAEEERASFISDGNNEQDFSEKSFSSNFIYNFEGEEDDENPVLGISPLKIPKKISPFATPPIKRRALEKFPKSEIPPICKRIPSKDSPLSKIPIGKPPLTTQGIRILNETRSISNKTSRKTDIYSKPVRDMLQFI